MAKVPSFTNPRAPKGGLHDTVTAPLPFTKANVRRRIAAALEAGLYVTGIAPDGTVLVGAEPKYSHHRSVDKLEPALATSWDDV